jgi:CheY-like chemotaxis protein
MARVELLIWNEADAQIRADRLRSLGHHVGVSTQAGQALLLQLRQSPPQVIVIDLDCKPSLGREIGAALRGQKATRAVPLVFAGGQADKVARVQEPLLDAIYTGWDQVDRALQQALDHPPAVVSTARSAMDVYAGRPLPQKLGIKPGLRVLLLNAPPDLDRALQPLPERARLLEDPAGPAELALWFVGSQIELAAGFNQAANIPGLRGLWIAWPKKASGVATDLTQQFVREFGLGQGWVDYKVCSIDATWTGLLFARRKVTGEVT